MNFIKNILGKKSRPIQSYEDFWVWFQAKEKGFFKVVKERGDIEKFFFGPLSHQLNLLRDGFWYLTGMYNETTAELIITADGIVKNMVFVEELIEKAPDMRSWKFTALKPALDIGDFTIGLADYQFNKDKLQFYAQIDKEFPDEVNISIVYDQFNEADRILITNGVYIFLDNYLGELDFAITIDNINIVEKPDNCEALIPIEKLKSYLSWRQKEFIVKYETVRRHMESDEFSIIEARLETGETLVALINMDLLYWESRASHPWILTIQLPYEGTQNGDIPDEAAIELMSEIENRISMSLRDLDGYLNIGRQTSRNQREIFFACKEFRKPSKLLAGIQDDYAQRINIGYDIYKDKYWKTFDRFKQV